MTNNGSGASLVSVSGTLTNNYASKWKVYGKTSGDNFLGTVNTADGTYTIPIQASVGSLRIVAYRDDNRNGRWDADPVGAVNLNGESAYVLQEFSLTVLTNEVNAWLASKVIRGTVTGSAAADFGRISAGVRHSISPYRPELVVGGSPDGGLDSRAE